LNNIKNKNITALVLSAGLSGRMGAYKPLLKFKGKSFIQNIVEKLNSVCEKIVIVTGYRSNDIENEINSNINDEMIQKIEFVFNEDFAKGMFLSLKKGIGACSDADWILYHFVDQPSIPFRFYSQFTKQIDDAYDWIQPVINERKGHPVLFGSKMKEEIMGANVNSNLKKLSRMEINKKYWQCNFKQIFDDIDNINDYKVLLSSNR